MLAGVTAGNVSKNPQFHSRGALQPALLVLGGWGPRNKAGLTVDFLAFFQDLQSLARR